MRTRKRAGKTERDFRCPIYRSAIGHALVLLATSLRCHHVFFAKSAYYVGMVVVRPRGWERQCNGRFVHLCPYGHLLL